MAGTDAVPQAFNDLAVWRTSLQGVQHAVLPPFTDRPNPRLSGGMVFASVFAPGNVYALDATNGEICWRRELPYLGSSSVEVAGNRLLAKTAQTLYALDPLSGITQWEFSPYGSEGETLYSQPALDGNRLFIGDRLGWLYCLDVDTGQTLWTQKTSADTRSDVNATATFYSGLVITATNAGLALAYSVEDGRLVWQANLDGPCINHLFMTNKQVVAAAESLHFFQPLTGELLGRVQWPGFAVAFAAGTPSQVGVFRRQSGNAGTKSDDSNPAECTTMLLFEGTRLLHEVSCSRYASAVRYSDTTGLLYASGLLGLDILDAETGERLNTLRDAEASSGYGLPDVAEKRIYTLDGRGVVWALRHPMTA